VFDDNFGPAQPLSYDEFAGYLLEQGMQESPSLLHGGLSGALAAGVAPQADDCVAAVCAALSLEIRGGLAEQSLQLADATINALGSDEFEYHLFLPDDEDALEERLIGLGDWCRGFLAGYALALAEGEQTGLGDEIAEILKDMAAVAQVAPDSGSEEDEEDAEHDYFDLTEYLRFAVLNLYMDREAARQEEA
jgi:uncharacterized protein YgfB (UPF0149 family)